MSAVKATERIRAAMQELVNALTAPHEGHCGECNGGRSDCCDECSVMDSMITPIAEAEDAMGISIVLPDVWRRDREMREQAAAAHMAARNPGGAVALTSYDAALRLAYPDRLK